MNVKAGGTKSYDCYDNCKHLIKVTICDSLKEKYRTVSSGLIGTAFLLLLFLIAAAHLMLFSFHQAIVSNRSCSSYVV
jgi:hypothetical protein